MPRTDPQKSLDPSPSGREDIGICIGRISYLNVDPIYYGLENGLKPSRVQILSAPPSSLNRLMGEGKLDISPVSTGACIHHQDDWLILPDLSISCRGPVMSVLLASRVPLDELDGRRVLLTSESGTAVLLLRLIFAIRGITPEMRSGPIDEASLSSGGDDAVMVIGDKALSGKWQKRYEHLMDLGELWYQLTGLPIVFAVWAVRKPFAEAHPDQVDQVIALFRDSARMGRARMDRIIAGGAERMNLSEEKIRAYFDAMQYDLEETKRQALTAFFDGLYENRIIPETVRLSFFDRR